jgi:cell division control protein 45
MPLTRIVQAEISSMGADDKSIRFTDQELKFMLFRHWSLYESMFHSSYVASKLGIWREKGKKKLHNLLTKMGYACCAL